MIKGGRYNWKYADTRPLIYLGHNLSGNGYWHQFATVENPEVVWCEVTDRELHMIEETIDQLNPPPKVIKIEAPDYDLYNLDFLEPSWTPPNFHQCLGKKKKGGYKRW